MTRPVVEVLRDQKAGQSRLFARRISFGLKTNSREKW